MHDLNNPLRKWSPVPSAQNSEISTEAILGISYVLERPPNIKIASFDKERDDADVSRNHFRRASFLRHDYDIGASAKQTADFRFS